MGWGGRPTVGRDLRLQMVELHAKIIGCVLRQCRADCADRRRHGVDRIDRALGQQCAACLEIETELELRVDGLEEGIEFRSEERRVGTEWVSQCSSRWAQYH